ncbi:hypothetical protein C0585_02175 [Candidatus Woesearchaeota archaeon]|nr:MAG: hypothetical protein C0585_02175 [Candidatus Woesearchaeota archaeon]
MEKIITATHFYNFVQCPHRLFLDTYETEDEKVPISEFMKSKIDQGMIHEKDAVKDLEFSEVQYETSEEGFKKTLDLMKKGVNQIYQCVLVHEDLLGRPDLLIRKEGESIFGNYYYEAIDIKSGKNLKKEYRMQVIFYTYILGKIQGFLPEKGYVINSQKEEIPFNISPEYPEFKKALKKIREVFSIGSDYDYYLSSSCNECQWREVCLKEAIKKNDLSLIYRLSKRAKDNLLEQDIKDIVELSKKEPEDIKLWNGVSLGTIAKWIIQSKSLVRDKEIILAKPRFKKTRYELFFDIEGETKLGIDYLYGVIVRDTENNSEKYHPFFSKEPDDEKKVWDDFLDLIESLEDDFVIYYYTSYEVSSLKRMKERYGCNIETYNMIIKRLVDLFPIVTRNVVLPIYSYSIKPIAKYLGFKWSNKDAGGTQSMYWYSMYLEGNQEYKDIIIEYNKDYCEATLVLKDWLENLQF